MRLCGGKMKVDERGLVGCWACVIPLTGIQIHRRRALSPQSAHHIKAPGFAGLQTESLFFPRLFSFLSVRTGFLLLLGVAYTKESTIITAVICHYSFSPTRVLVNCRTKSLQNRQCVLVQTTGQFIVPA